MDIRLTTLGGTFLAALYFHTNLHAKTYQEQNGYVVIEAEDFASQHLTEKRQ